MSSSLPLSRAYAAHSRNYLNFRYVYPVFSRRSGGLSIGINLNPDKGCNFDCIYCQVDRREPANPESVELSGILHEVREIFESVRNRSLFSAPLFREIPETAKKITDIALSGDGEPSLYPRLFELTRELIALKSAEGLSEIPVVLISNASGFSRPETARAIKLILEDSGAVWAKLDAGTESYFRRICRPGIALGKIVQNIKLASRIGPIIIQTCLMNIRGEEPSDAEIEAYCGRLREISDDGGRIDHVQLYTVARRPAEEWVTPIKLGTLRQIAGRIQAESGMKVRVYGSAYDAGTGQ
jgi:wyosine [tRNA(Phe)-imidazoG37] synthetase (radical SAM superfamily)